MSFPEHELADKLGYNDKIQSIQKKTQEQRRLYFLDWQADFYTRRSYRKFKDVQKIDISEQAEKNFKQLMTRLKTLSGPYSEEMKEILKIKQNGKTLTTEEKKVLIEILRMPWYSKHVTAHYESIQNSGNQLMSLDHRRRHHENPKNANTMASEGNTDNVFLSMNPGKDFETVHFLNNVTTEIRVDNQKINDTNPSALKGTWSSGHIYAFITEQDDEPINIFGTVYRVNYRKSINEISKEEEWTKTCLFKHPDGKEYHQILGKKDEIFVYPRIEFAVALMAIEKFRLLGKFAWEQIMVAESKELQDLVQILFHSGVFEVHKPAILTLHQPGISVLQRKPKTIAFEANDQEKMYSLIMKVLQGKGDKIIKNFPDDLPLDIILQMNNNYSINLLAAAILTGNLSLVSLLLDKGVDLSRNDLHIPLGKDAGGNSHTQAFGPIGFAVLLSKPGLAKKVIRKMLGNQFNHELSIDQNVAPDLVHLLIQGGSKFKKNKNITRPLSVSATELSNIIFYFRPRPKMVKLLLQGFYGKGEDLPLVEAMSLQCPELVEMFIFLGAKLDGKSMQSDHGFRNIFNSKPSLPGITPLIAAIQANNTEMVEMLLKHKASPNLIYDVSNFQDIILDETPPCKLFEPQGFSPLMFSVTLGNIKIVQLLLNAGADVSYRSPQGQTAFSIAKKTQRNDILSLLQKQIKPEENYPLHEAALKKDWVLCRSLLDTGYNDLTLNHKGCSAYDLVPGMLEQSFIPIQRTAEKYHAFVHMARIIVMGHDAYGHRFFVLFHSESDDETLRHFFPFIAMPLQAFSRTMMEEYLEEHLFEAFNSRTLEDQPKWSSFGTLSAGFVEKGIHYADHFEILELDGFASNRLLTLKSSGTAVIYESDLKKYSAFFVQGMQEIAHQGVKLTKLPLRLLKFLSHNKEMAPFSREVISAFNKLYFEQRWAAHKLLDAATEGDTRKLEEIIQYTGVSVNQAIPTLSTLSYSNNIGVLDQFYGRNNVVLRAAIFANQVSCAEHLIEKHEALLPRVISDKTLKKIVELGNPVIFSAYAFVLIKMDENVAQHIDPYILTMIRQSKLSLLAYLINHKFIRKSYEEIILEAIHCFAVDVVKAFLPYVKDIDSLADKLSLYAVFLTYGGDFKNSNLSLEHLTQKAQNEAVLALVKLIIPFHKKKGINIYAQSSWIMMAYKKDNLPLIQELMNAFPIKSYDVWYFEKSFAEFPEILSLLHLSDECGTSYQDHPIASISPVANNQTILSAFDIYLNEGSGFMQSSVLKCPRRTPDR